MKTFFTKAKKILLSVYSAILLLVLGAATLLNRYLLNYAIGRGGSGGDRKVALDVTGPDHQVQKTIEENRTAQMKINRKFLSEHKEKPVSIRSNDGYILNGGYFPNGKSHLWAITIHGYRSSHTRMTSAIQHFYDAGYQVLAPDLRACGTSEGNFVGMGWLDRKDILKWINWIIHCDPNAEIVVYGVSMGAATTMMTAGEHTPDQVKVFIEDCGYTSAWDIFANEMRLRFHLPAFPILHTANIISRIVAGYSFRKASALTQVAHCEKPMLFIHGTADDFIPYSMMNVLYQAKPGTNKASVTAEGAGHTEAMYVLGDRYWNTVFRFIAKYNRVS